ncbi:MAG: hypothetical protein ACFFDN_15705 [Candidatus Hodarchaeota archaeon]
MLQKNYGEFNKIDKDLFSGFITAFFNFSEELSGESIRSVTMGSFKFFYLTTETMILTVAADFNLNETDIGPIMEEIISEFLVQGYGNKLTPDGIEESLFRPFAPTLDNIISNANENLHYILEQRKERGTTLEIKKPISKIANPLVDAMKVRELPVVSIRDAEVIKERVIEALENAEYAVNNSQYEEATIYYGVAAGLFNGLGDYENANICTQFAIKSKEMALYKGELELQEIEVEKTTPLPIEAIDESIVEIVPIIDEQLIQNEKTRDIVRKAYQAEEAKRYAEAITYYNSAAGLFLIDKDRESSNKCSERIKELIKKQQLEASKPKFVEEKSAEEEIYSIPPPVSVEITEKTDFLQKITDTEKEVELLINEELISDSKIKNLLKNAALAEKLELYDKALKFYFEAAEKFATIEDQTSFEKCRIKINELNKRLEIEGKPTPIEPSVEEEELLIPEEEIPNEEIKNILKNAAIAERLELYDRALKFYSEACDKFADYNDIKNRELCIMRIYELNKLADMEARIEGFVPIIPLKTIEDERIKKNLERAYDAELQQKFKQAVLYYNIATNLFSAINDKKNSELCAKMAKELAELNK